MRPSGRSVKLSGMKRGIRIPTFMIRGFTWRGRIGERASAKTRAERGIEPQGMIEAFQAIRRHAGLD